MKSEKIIINRIVELSRGIGQLEVAKDQLKNAVSEDENAVNQNQEAIKNYEMQVSLLSAELNALRWLFIED